MADEDNLGPLLQDLAQYGTGIAGAEGANAAVQSAYRAIIKNLQDRFGDYSDLKPAGYKSLTAEKLGPSALEGITPDAQARADEQAAIAQLDAIAKSGGLDLGDMEALNKIERTLSRNAGARNASIANQYAARGQLGSGQQLAMELANAQHATESANERGESIAAQAQRRAMEAVLAKGKASHALSGEDYSRKKSAAEAADAIARHNAAMATDAAKYNNNVAGQTYDDELRKLSGQNQVTGQLNTALLGSGTQQGNTVAGEAYGMGGLIGGLAKTAGKLGKTKSSGSGGGGIDDPGLTEGGDADLAGDRGGPADISDGGHGGDGFDDDPGFTQYPTSDPGEWDGW